MRMRAALPSKLSGVLRGSEIIVTQAKSAHVRLADEAKAREAKLVAF